jgi:hypothetical protein
MRRRVLPMRHQQARTYERDLAFVGAQSRPLGAVHETVPARDGPQPALDAHAVRGLHSRSV